VTADEDRQPAAADSAADADDARAEQQPAPQPAPIVLTFSDQPESGSSA
jgi:hypothetical protein